MSDGVSRYFPVRPSTPGREEPPERAAAEDEAHYGDRVSAVGIGRRRQDEIYRAGVYGRTPSVPTAARALQRRAEQALSARAYGYVAGGAGSEATQRADDG